MKKLFLRFSLALALSFGVKAGIAQQQDAQPNGGEKAVEAVVIEDTTVTAAVAEKPAATSVVVKKKVLTEAELKNKLANVIVFLDYWYEYDGSGPLNDPASYIKTTRTDGNITGLCPVGPDVLCAIKVTADATNDTHPDATALAAMQTAIAAALGAGTSTSTIRLTEESPN